MTDTHRQHFRAGACMFTAAQGLNPKRVGSASSTMPGGSNTQSQGGGPKLFFPACREGSGRRREVPSLAFKENLDLHGSCSWPAHASGPAPTPRQSRDLVIVGAGHGTQKNESTGMSESSSSLGAPPPLEHGALTLSCLGAAAFGLSPSRGKAPARRLLRTLCSSPQTQGRPPALRPGCSAPLRVPGAQSPALGHAGWPATLRRCAFG